MPRPPAAKEGQPTKKFIVRHGFIIGDNNGTPRIGKGTLPHKEDIEGNDLIELTYEQAKYYRELNAIDVPLEDFSNASNDAADHTEAPAGGEADGAGEQPVGAVPEADAIPPKRKHKL